MPAQVAMVQEAAAAATTTTEKVAATGPFHRPGHGGGALDCSDDVHECV